MKGLLRPPKIDERLEAYERLQAFELLPEETVATFSQWARLDARLAELMVAYLAALGSEMRISRFLTALSLQPWPRAPLVLLRFAELKTKADKLNWRQSAVVADSSSALASLRAFIHAIEFAFPEATGDLYFIPMQSLNRVITNAAIDFQTEPYSRSGFVGSASLLAKGRLPKDVTILTKAARERLLERVFDTASGLLADKKSLTVERYVELCRGLVSRRQAQRDLEASSDFEAVGFTRNRRYRRRR